MELIYHLSKKLNKTKYKKLFLKLLVKFLKTYL